MRAILKATMRESDFFLAGVTLFTKRKSPWEGAHHTRLREHCEEVCTLGFRSIFLTFPLRNLSEGSPPSLKTDRVFRLVVPTPRDC